MVKLVLVAVVLLVATISNVFASCPAGQFPYTDASGSHCTSAPKGSPPKP
jgi:hypothetical protein